MTRKDPQERDPWKDLRDIEGVEVIKFDGSDEGFEDMADALALGSPADSPRDNEDYRLAMREADDATMEELEAAGEVFDLLTQRGAGYRRMGETLMPNQDLPKTQRVGGDPILTTIEPEWRRRLRHTATRVAIYSIQIGRFFARLGRITGTTVDCAQCQDEGYSEIALMTCRQCLVSFCEPCWQEHSEPRTLKELLGTLIKVQPRKDS